jgi:hypothetical protein
MCTKNEREKGGAQTLTKQGRPSPSGRDGEGEHSLALPLFGLYQAASDSPVSICLCVSVGAYVAWGGKLLEGHSIPPCYGSWHPTAVYVPIEV